MPQADVREFRRVECCEAGVGDAIAVTDRNISVGIGCEGPLTDFNKLHVRNMPQVEECKNR